MLVSIDTIIYLLRYYSQFAKIFAEDSFQNLSDEFLSNFRVCDHGTKQKIVKQIQIFKFPFYHRHFSFLRLKQNIACWRKEERYVLE